MDPMNPPLGDVSRSGTSTWLSPLYRGRPAFHHFLSGFVFSVLEQVLKSTQNVSQLLIATVAWFCLYLDKIRHLKQHTLGVCITSSEAAGHCKTWGS